MASLSWFTLFACVLIHKQTIVGNWWMGFATYGCWPVFWSTFQGLSYLSYPVLGLLSEVFRWNFKTILVSFVLMAVSSTTMLVTSTIWIIGQEQCIAYGQHKFTIIIVIQVLFIMIGIIIYDNYCSFPSLNIVTWSDIIIMIIHHQELYRTTCRVGM